MTGAELLAIARHNCPPGMSDHDLGLCLARALALLMADLGSARRIGWRTEIYEVLGRDPMMAEDAEP